MSKVIGWLHRVVEPLEEGAKGKKTLVKGKHDLGIGISGDLGYLTRHSLVSIDVKGV